VEEGNDAYLKHESGTPTHPVRQHTAQGPSTRPTNGPDSRRNAAEKAALPEGVQITTDNRRRSVHSSSASTCQEPRANEAKHVRRDSTECGTEGEQEHSACVRGPSTDDVAKPAVEGGEGLQIEGQKGADGSGKL
jgi:hypothetical protein